MRRILEAEIDDEAKDAVDAAVRLGFKPDDFLFEEVESSGLSHGVHPIMSNVIASRGNVQMMYEAGFGTAWPTEFESDIRAGVFGRP